VIREDSFIPQSEDIGRENPVKVVAGDGPKRKSSGDPLLILSDILRTLFPPQYDAILGLDVDGSKQLYPGLRWRAMRSSVSFLRISTCACVDLISNAVFASTNTERPYCDISPLYHRAIVHCDGSVMFWEGVPK
jgi:hypothetical protein